MIKRFYIAILSLTCLSASAQVSTKRIPINLETILKLAGANNLTIKQYDLLYKESLAQIDIANEWYLPTLYLGPEVHYLGGEAMSAFGVYKDGITQKELWLGGGISAQWNFGEGIYNVMAKKQEAVAVKFENQAQRNNVILTAISDYYDLLTSQFRYNQLQSLLLQADTISKQIKVQVDAGIRYQSEYLLAKTNYDHLKTDLSNTMIQLIQRSNALLNTLNIDTNALLVSGDTNIAPLELEKNITDTSMIAYNQYLANRPEYKSLQAEQKATADEKKTVTMGMILPKLYVSSVPDGVIGPIGPPFNAQDRVDGGLLWSIPLGALFYQGEIKSYNANLQMEQNSIAQLTNNVHEQVDNARTQIIIALQQIKNTSGALDESKKALEQSIQREKLGTVRPFEVFQTEQFYTQAEEDYLNAVSNYNKAQYQLYVATGNNL
jgi:outer membrane protein TolC